MNNIKFIKILGMAAMVIGFGAQVLGDWVDDKKLDAKINEKVNEKLTESKMTGEEP